MAMLGTDQDLNALFGIEIEGTADATPALNGIICKKCNGSGKFIGYSGRVVGNCFSCDGSGIERHAAKEIAPGDCAKCAGSGEWRPGRQCFACHGTGKTIIAPKVNVSRIEQAFASAKSRGITYPKLRLGQFQFSLAGAASRNPGAIYVKEQSSYLGKIVGGEFIATRDCGADRQVQVIEVACNPEAAAVAYGKATGSCSCCGRTLENKVSIERGIGPICAEKYGW